MKFILTFILSVLCFISFAQVSANDVQTVDMVVGQALGGKSITAKKYTFVHNIVKYDIDSASRRLILILQEKKKKRKHHIVSLNLNDFSINWSQKADGNSFVFTPHTVVEQDDHSTKCYDRHTGTLLWERNLRLMLFDQTMEVGITANGSAYDLRTGQEIWMRNLDYITGLLDVTKTDDSSLFLITTQALHRVNTRTSKGWKYNVLPMNAAYNRAYGQNAFLIGAQLGMQYGALGGVIGSLAASAISSGLANYEKRHSLQISNAISEGDKTYIVSDKKLACMNAENLEWEVDIPKNFISPFSVLSVTNDIWVIGKAVANTRTNTLTARFIVFNKQTGKIISEFTERENVLFKSIVAGTNGISVLLDKKLYLFDAFTHQMLSEKKVPDISNVCTGIFDAGPYYIEQNGSFVRLNEQYPNDIFLNRDTTVIYRHNHHMLFQDSITTDKVYSPSAKHGAYTFVHTAKKPDEHLMLSDGEKKAVVYAGDLFIVNDKIISIQQDNIYAIDVNEIID